MMKITRKPVEIDEVELAKDLGLFLYEALSYQNEEIAKEVAYGDDDIQRLAVLNKVGEIWMNDFNEIAPEKGV